MKYIELDFCSEALVMPKGVGLGGARCAQGSKFSFLNMVMWHIKLKGITSRTEWQ